MPKFTQTEKESIRQELKESGQLLFIRNGIKKVTIDDLANSAQIAKATFYSFYENKESLYLDIVASSQAEIFHSLCLILEKNKLKPSKIRVKEIFYEMSHILLNYPLLQQIDEDTIKIITRKASKQQLQHFLQSNYNAADLLIQHGIPFAYDPVIISEAFQAIYHAWISMNTKSSSIRDTVTELLLDGLLDKIVL